MIFINSPFHQSVPEPDEIVMDWLLGELELFLNDTFCDNDLVFLEELWSFSNKVSELTNLDESKNSQNTTKKK